MDAEHFKTLFDYYYWGRDRLLGAAQGISEEEYAASTGFTYDTLRSMLTHTVNAEIAWLNRMRGGSATPLGPATEDALPTLESLAARWSEVESVLRDFLRGLNAGELERVVEYRMRDGAVAKAAVWQLLMIVYTHTVQHRSEAAEVLTRMGRSPGNLDFVIYMREQVS